LILETEVFFGKTGLYAQSFFVDLRIFNFGVGELTQERRLGATD
jgi:hypothetical protein